MNKNLSKLIAVLFLMISVNLSSQNSNQIPCATKEYKQFDFWLGNWNVYDTKDNLIGKNRIVKMPNACAIQENWESKTGPSLGTSYNYYNAKNKTWNQVWIDNGGGSLVLKGNRIKNKMILKSGLSTNKNGTFYNKVTWTKKANGNVEQVWEVVNKNHKVINEVFRGIYKKNSN